MKQTRLTTRLAAFVLAVLLAAGLTACGSASTGATASEVTQESMADSAAPGGSGPLLDPEALETSNRKIVYTANLSMESTDFAASQQAILTAVEQAGAYLQSTDLWGSESERDRRAEYCIRVPVDNYRDLLTSLGQAGSLLSQSESTDDVTTQYIDVQARLTSLEAQRDRLNELADQAETTADLLEIESQLSEVQYQIESYTAQLRTLDSQVSYSTVRVSLSEVTDLTPTGSSFGDRVSAAFFGGWRTFVDLLEWILLAILFLLPLLIVGGLIAVLCVVLVRRHRKCHPAAPKPTVSYTVPAPGQPGQKTDAGPDAPAPDTPSTPKY